MHTGEPLFSGKDEVRLLCICGRKEIVKMENSLLVIFVKMPCTIVHGLWPDFGATLKIRKKSNFDQNQLKLETQHKDMYVYQKKL